MHVFLGLVANVTPYSFSKGQLLNRWKHATSALSSLNYTFARDFFMTIMGHLHLIDLYFHLHLRDAALCLLPLNVHPGIQDFFFKKTYS